MATERSNQNPPGRKSRDEELTASPDDESEPRSTREQQDQRGQSGQRGGSGNFANDRARASEAGRKGGQH